MGLTTATQAVEPEAAVSERERRMAAGGEAGEGGRDVKDAQRFLHAHTITLSARTLRTPPDIHTLKHTDARTRTRIFVSPSILVMVWAMASGSHGSGRARTWWCKTSFKCSAHSGWNSNRQRREGYERKGAWWVKNTQHTHTHTLNTHTHTHSLSLSVSLTPA